MIRDLEEILYTNEQIVARCKELGEQITKDYEDKFPVVVGMLKGSVPFMAELIKHINCHMETDYMEASSYLGTKSTLIVNIKKDTSVNITGRHVLIVEDIIDTGLTLTEVLNVLRRRDPASIEIVSLLNKEEGRTVSGLNAKYNGFEIPNKFVVGFGLDYNQKYRNLGLIGVLKKEVYS